MANNKVQSWQADLLTKTQILEISKKTENINMEKNSIDDEIEEKSIMNDFNLFIKRLFDTEKRMENQLDEIHVDKGVSLSEVLLRLEILCPDLSKSSPPDTYNHISILSQYLQSYLKLIDQNALQELSSRISTDTTKWLSSLFRLDNMHSYFHNKKIDGLLKVCKLALHSKYSKYGSDGFTALYTRPPVIYISAAAPPEFGKILRNELGLPQSSICTVQCNTMFGSPYIMDVTVFERLLTDDVSCGKTPLLLIGYAGTPLSGHTDNLSRLREICTQSGVWFHVEGDTLANLALNNVQPSVQVAANADSLTFNLPHWFGMSTLPYCTFYKNTNPTMAVSSGLVSGFVDQLIVLPLWITIQFMGTHDLYKMIEHASEMAQQISHRLDVITDVQRLEQPTGISPVIIFKYKSTPPLPLSLDSNVTEGVTKKQEKLVAPRGNVEVSAKLKDAFNQLLTTYLQSVVPKVSIESLTIPREGVCMKFAPLHTSRKFETSKTDIDEFIEKLQGKTSQFSHTLISRRSFREVLQNIADIALLDSTDDPILGAFQCIPQYWQTKKMSNLSDVKKHEANDLNTRMYLNLSDIYPFVNKSLLANGQMCIQVGVVDETFNLSKFAETLTRCMVELEDNAKFVESLTDTVQKSIEEAQERLEREREEQFFQDGVLRNVPLVSSLYNWWSPPPATNHGVVGRSLDLSSGKLESTDKIYKFKMQIHCDDSDAGSHVSSGSHYEGLSNVDDVANDDNDESSAGDDSTMSEVDSADDESNVECSDELLNADVIRDNIDVSAENIGVTAKNESGEYNLKESDV